jgi:hypothetical protein
VELAEESRGGTPSMEAGGEGSTPPLTLSSPEAEVEVSTSAEYPSLQPLLLSTDPPSVVDAVVAKRSKPRRRKKRTVVEFEGGALRDFASDATATPSDPPPPSELAPDTAAAAAEDPPLDFDALTAETERIVAANQQVLTNAKLVR